MYHIQYLDYDAIWKNIGLSDIICTVAYSKRKVLIKSGFPRPSRVFKVEDNSEPKLRQDCLGCTSRECMQ